MQNLTEHNSWWLNQDRKEVLIDGLAHCLQTSTYRASFPYERDVITVYAEPINKCTKHYLKVRRELGDDWSTDVLESGIELQVAIKQQLQN